MGRSLAWELDEDDAYDITEEITIQRKVHIAAPATDRGYAALTKAAFRRKPTTLPKPMHDEWLEDDEDDEDDEVTDVHDSWLLPPDNHGNQ